jgi:hypothetical protein
MRGASGGSVDRPDGLAAAEESAGRTASSDLKEEMSHAVP